MIVGNQGEIACTGGGDGKAVYSGVNTLNLDAKGRLAIPAMYRESLAEACASRLVLTINPSKTNRCLWLFPEPAWLDVVRKISRLPAFEPRSQAYKRLLLGHASPQELDSQGRIRIAPELRGFAGLDKRVSIVGQYNKFELWDEASWNGSREGWLDLVELDEGGLPEALGEITL